MTEGGFGQAEMCVMVVAVADATKLLLGYASEAAKLRAVILRMARTMWEMEVGVKQTSKAGVMNALLERPEMRRLASAGAEATRELLGYHEQSVELAAAMLRMVRVTLTVVHA